MNSSSLRRAVATVSVCAAGFAGTLVVTPAADAAPHSTRPAERAAGTPVKTDLGYKATVYGTKLLLDGVVERVRESVPWRPGARELLTALGEAGVACALVTMSYQRFVEPILEHLPEGAFRAVITGDQVSNGKPHPEPYLVGAAALGVPPEQCVAIEDSPTGATSAGAAGCQVLVVPNHVPVPLRPGWIEVGSLADLDVEQLKTLRYRDQAAADLL